MSRNPKSAIQETARLISRPFALFIHSPLPLSVINEYPAKITIPVAVTP